MPDDLLTSILKVSNQYGFKSIAEQVQYLQNSGQNAQYVDLVVMGQFKAGKSSFINSILNKPLLPVGVLPVTSIVTRISFGENTKAVIEQLDGKRLEVAPEVIHKYIAENENPNNTKEIALVDIFSPEIKSFKHVRFIDTPGLGSIYKHNSQTTQDWYFKAGAAFVVVNAVQPLSDSDLELIKTLTELSPMVYIIISKTDLVNMTELSKIENFISEKTTFSIGKPIKTFSFSTQIKTNDFRKRILQEIILPLSDSFVNTTNKINDYKLTYLRKLLQSYLKISLHLHTKKEDERNLLKNKIIDEQLSLKYAEQELQLIVDNYKAETRKKLNDQITDKYKNHVTQLLKTELTNNFPSWKGNLSKLSRNYESWLKTAMSRAISDVEIAESDFIQGCANKTQDHLRTYLTRFREKLNQNLDKVLGIRIPDKKIEIIVPPLEKTNISVSWAFESQIDLLWFLIPMPIFRNYFLNYFLKQLPRETEKNLFRLVSFLTYNTNNAIDKLYD